MKLPYTEAFKEQALAKVFQRGDRTIQAVADELNINAFTLKNWMKKRALTDQPPAQPKVRRPGDWRPEERLAALQESYVLKGEALHAWCREKGLFAHHLSQWAQAFCQSTGISREEPKALRALQVENQQLQRELSRKEKALAEAAALLVLQKKYRALLGGEVA